MAKKKSSKKNKRLIQLITFVSALFGIAAVCMGFVKFVTYDGALLDFDVSGFQTAFGYSETKSGLGMSLTVNYLAFSFMNLLPFICALFGTLLVLGGLFGKSGFLTNVIALALFVVAAVFFFLSPSMIVLAEDSILNAESFSLAIGAILAGSFSAVSACLMLGKWYLKG